MVFQNWDAKSSALKRVNKAGILVAGVIIKNVSAPQEC